jgi:adenosylcobyric acid synthase
MIQGTMSNAGKSIIATGLCRIFAQDGYRVAPFKSQNMALNSFITADGGEMGRAQVVQAEAAGQEPTVAMNPILLKPVTDQGSQVIVQGRARGIMTAREYFATRATLLPQIMAAFRSLDTANDIIVVEGAGSPAEINLRTDDIVNMGLAQLISAPVLLVGDIDRGGVFAQLVGTLALLTDSERALVHGLVINKFRGDPSLLRGGLDELESLTGRPVLGVVPYLRLDIDEEDSLSERLIPRGAPRTGDQGDRLGGAVRGRPACRHTARSRDIAVVRLPRISNFTDFTALGATAGLSVRYVESPGDLGCPDLLILPGTRNTIADLGWLRTRGWDQAIVAHAARGQSVVGICGGYQMLGRSISDPDGVEGGGTVTGLGLLPVHTHFHTTKRQTRQSGTILPSAGPLAATAGCPVEGYELHMGDSHLDPGASPWIHLADGTTDGCWYGSVHGTYLHGLFDYTPVRRALLTALGSDPGPDPIDYVRHKHTQYDLLAEALRTSLDIDQVYRIMGVAR